MMEPATLARAAQRFLLLPPVEGTFGPLPVAVSDLSVTGARFHHRAPIESGSKAILRLWDDGSPSQVSFEGSVVWTQSSRETTPVGFVSGIKLYNEVQVVQRAIDQLLEARRSVRVEECRTGDRLLLSPSLRGELGDVGPVRVEQISARGARIETRELLPPGMRCPLSFTLPDTSFDIAVEAEVIWSRLKAIYSPTENRYHSGLRIVARSEQMRLAMGRMYELNQGTHDTSSLGLKLRIMRAKVRSGEPARSSAVLSDMLESHVVLIDGVRRELLLNDEAGNTWREMARVALREPTIRGLAGPIAANQEALAVWEYLDRTVDASIIAAGFSLLSR